MRKRLFHQIFGACSLVSICLSEAQAADDFDKDGIPDILDTPANRCTGAFGQWSYMEITCPVLKSGESLTLVDVNDLGEMLFAGTRTIADPAAEYPEFDPDDPFPLFPSSALNFAKTAQRGLLRNADGQWREITATPHAGEWDARVKPEGLNNRSEIVGTLVRWSEQVPVGTSTGFLCDARDLFPVAAPWLLNGVPVSGIRNIADCGDLIGRRTAPARDFFGALDGTMISDATGLDQPRFLDINAWGQSAGTFEGANNGEMNLFYALGSWLQPTDWLVESYEDDFKNLSERHFEKAFINDDGELAANFMFEGSDRYRGSYFWDGKMHLLPDETRVIDLATGPWLLARNYERGRYELHSASQFVKLTDLHPTITSTHIPLLLNNAGAVFGGAGGASWFVLHLEQDRDGDGMPDDWESFYHLDPDSPADASADFDNDDLANLTEFRMQTNPTLADPALGNTGVRRGIDDDGDGLPNWFELTYQYGKHPNDDVDGDGLSAILEYLLGSSPDEADTDNDGLTDAEEANIGTHPARPDTDLDGLFDGQEVFNFQTAPLEKDTDGDGASDGLENEKGTDPKDPNSTPECRLLRIVNGRTETGSSGEATADFADGWEKQTKQRAGIATTLQLGLEFADPDRDHKFHLLRVNAPEDTQRFESGDIEGYTIVESIQVTIPLGHTRSASYSTQQDGQFFFLLPVEVRVRQDVSHTGPHGSGAMYSTPRPDNGQPWGELFSLWENEEGYLTLGGALGALADAGTLPTGFVKWSNAELASATNHKEYRVIWSTTGLKEVELEIGAEKFTFRLTSRTLEDGSLMMPH